MAPDDLRDRFARLGIHPKEIDRFIERGLTPEDVERIQAEMADLEAKGLDPITGRAPRTGRTTHRVPLRVVNDNQYAPEGFWFFRTNYRGRDWLGRETTSAWWHLIADIDREDGSGVCGVKAASIDRTTFSRTTKGGICWKCLRALHHQGGDPYVTPAV